MVTLSDQITVSDTSPQLDTNGKLLLQSFQQILCKELDSRFSNFCKTEIGPLKHDVSCVKSDLAALKGEIKLLKDQNASLSKKLEKSDSQISQLEKDANLIFYNVNSSSNIRQAILEICRTVLRVGEDISITRTIILKKHPSSGALTVLVKFETLGMVYKVLSSTKNLKSSGSGIWISRDLSEEERKIKSSLLIIKKKINEKDTSCKVKVVGKKMYVDSVMFIFNEKHNTFGNSQMNGKVFLLEKFSINFDDVVDNNQ